MHMISNIAHGYTVSAELTSLDEEGNEMQAGAGQPTIALQSFINGSLAQSALIGGGNSNKVELTFSGKAYERTAAEGGVPDTVTVRVADNSQQASVHDVVTLVISPQ